MTRTESAVRPAPELLAPAGNWECIHAAIENGADAVYFGLDAGFNARARAVNFSLDDLSSLMELLHRRGVLGYVTLNTLVFTDELEQFETHVRQLAMAGVDAVLVQDLGAVRLIHEVCPQLSVHASTQMTMVSAETIAAIESLNVDRVVLARELSIAEIQKITSLTTMPVETFVHGALCVAYSGQCLTSESLGGRSANRGQCAQACRLDYELIRDGELVKLGDNRYLLSPQDLAAYEHIPQLIDAGVCSLKIEGRLKTPEYVANIVGHYRKAIDQAMVGRPLQWTPETKREMELSFSRGFTPGWLEGCNHKRLVPGISSAKRGVLVGKVVRQRGDRLVVDLDVPLIKGDGVVLQGDRIAGKEFGGRIFQIFVNNASANEPASGRVELAFQNGLLANAEVYPGQAIWQTDSPQLTRRLKATFASEQFLRKRPFRVHGFIAVGKPVSFELSWIGRDGEQRQERVEVAHVPEEARKHPITIESLESQLGRLGNTPFQLETVTAEISGAPMIPLSVLGEVRKEIVRILDEASIINPTRTYSPTGAARRLLELAKRSASNVVVSNQDRVIASGAEKASADERSLTSVDEEVANAMVHVLCRSLPQLEAVLAEGQKSVYADFHDIREYRQAVALARQAGAQVRIATLRIQKPGETGLFKALRKHEADGWLVRNLAAVDYASKNDIPFLCDFSLNVTNPLTAQWLIQRGAKRVTASYDLNRDQLTELVSGMPASSLEIVIHQHMPMFHMEHCVFCTVLSPGTNKSNCGRPCDRHDVKLRDRLGVEHVLHADIGCRNTLYNGNAQSGAEAVQKLQRMGVRHYRVELLRDAPSHEIQKLLRLYRDLVDGKIDGASVWKALKAENRVGVTRGTLEHPRNPLALL